MSGEISNRRYHEGEFVDDRDNERLQKLKSRLRRIQRTVTYQENGSFITISRGDFVELTNQACGNTIDAHGDQVNDAWMNSFRKRFWGELKNLHHNRQEPT